MAATKALTLTESPETAKQRFQFRPLYNWLFCGAVFAFVALLLALFIPGPLLWLCDGFAIAALFYINFFVLEKRAINIRCPSCGRHIATNVPWMCGNCGKKNVKTDEFPFIYRCEHPDCGAETTAYKCHYADCGELIFFTKDKRRTNFAFSPDDSQERKQRDERTNRVTSEERSIEDRRRALVMAELDDKLESFKQRREFAKEKDPADLVRKDYQKRYAAAMAAEDVAAEEHAAIDKRYPNDKAKRERAHEFVNDWLKSRL